MKISYLAGMDVSASGMVAQRTVMNTVAENLANAQTTRTETGQPYRRKVATLSEQALPFEASLPAPSAQAGSTGAAAARPAAESSALALNSDGVSGVRASVDEDPSEFPQVYDPGHPDADGDGMVRLPNVDTAREMVTMLAASRAYEANVAALQAARRLADSSLNMAR